MSLRIGIDLGGSKTSAIAFDDRDSVVASQRVPTPCGDYAAAIAAIRSLVAHIESGLGTTGTVGVGMPGSISPATGRVQNANSTWLNGRDLQHDLETQLARPVRLANDANCFALSEAADGAAAGAHTVFGVILGTGCGGGVVVDKKVLAGRHSISGEWGHTPLPWPDEDERPGPTCWCGKHGCLETWVSGTGLERDHKAATARAVTAADIADAAAQGDTAARICLERHASRLARGLAVVVNILDPDVIVLGGGLSNLRSLYDVLPGLMAPHLFADHANLDIRAPLHGDDSGVRGAARLWGHTLGDQADHLEHHAGSDHRGDVVR